MTKNTNGEIFIISDFRFQDVSVQELEELRKSETAGLVLKIDGRLYYAEISKDVNLSSANYFGNHMCSFNNVTCKRLSAATDEEGGCAKVRDFSCGIERYDWITRGYETFGTTHDVFVVAQCNHFEKCPPRKSVSVIRKKELHESLREFLHDRGNDYKWWSGVMPSANKKSHRGHGDSMSSENR